MLIWANKSLIVKKVLRIFFFWKKNIIVPIIM